MWERKQRDGRGRGVPSTWLDEPVRLAMVEGDGESSVCDLGGGVLPVTTALT
jgi:hypothetical protein